MPYCLNILHQHGQILETKGSMNVVWTPISVVLNIISYVA